MKTRNAAKALVLEMPTSDLERARQLIMISIGFWLCLGVLTAVQTSHLA